MANEIITTLHPDQDPDTNLYPNIKKDNIPDGSVDINKLDPSCFNDVNTRIDNVNTRIDDLSDGSPRYVNTSSNILALTTNQGLAVGTDTGHWYYWDGSHYVDGGVYQATGIDDRSITPKLTSFLYDIGKNKFDKNDVSVGLRYYENGSYSSDPNYRYSGFIELETGINYKINSVAHVCYYDIDKQFISGQLVLSNNYTTLTLPNNTKYVVLSIPVAMLAVFMLLNVLDNINYENYSHIFKPNIYLYNEYHRKYTFMYIKDQKVTCDKVNDTRTSQYASIDFGNTPKSLQCNFIYDNQPNLGTIGFVCHNGNQGINNIYSITDRSLHLVIFNNRLTLTCLGQVYGHYYYAILIDVDVSSILINDGVTENVLKMVINNQSVDVIFNGNTFTGTFVDQYEQGRKLENFIGQYCVIEDHCDGDRNNFAMPYFTKFVVKDDTHVAYDDFKRENGSLYTMPTGEKYYLMNNEIDQYHLLED